MESLLPYNNAVLIVSKVSKEAATLLAKNCRSQQPQCPFTPPPRWTQVNICIYRIFLET